MNVTMVTRAQRWIALVLLVVAIALVPVRFITDVPELLETGVSWRSVLSGVSLAGHLVLAVLWASWTVRLLRGTTARVEVIDSGEVHVQKPWGTTEVHGLTPQGVTVHSFLEWRWVRMTGTGVVVNGTELPNVLRRVLVVAGPARNAEQVAAWLRSSLAPAGGPY